MKINRQTILMHERKIITGSTADQVWPQIEHDLNAETLEYNVLIRHNNRDITVDIDVDYGGGFEGGYAETALVSPLLNTDGFKFAIHKENFGDEIGKFFGMQDIIIGHPDFDEKFIIKTNNETKVKQVFSDDSIRSVLLSLDEPFTFGTTAHDHKKVLEFTTDAALTDAGRLKLVYMVFCKVLEMVDAPAI